MFEAVDQFSSDGSETGPPSPVVETKSKNKKKRIKREQNPVDPEPRLRATLGKACKCKLGCMAHFTKQERFERLLAFRKEWDDLHKLDQDQVAPQFIYWVLFVMACFLTCFCLGERLSGFGFSVNQGI